MNRTVLLLLSILSACAVDVEFGSTESSLGIDDHYPGGSTGVFGDRPNNGPFLLAHDGVEDSPYLPSTFAYVKGDASRGGVNGTLEVALDAGGTAGLRFISESGVPIAEGLAGTTFEDTRGDLLAIEDDSVFGSLSGPSATNFSYRVYQITKYGAPLCSGDNIAIAIPGHFDGNADLKVSGGEFSLACAAGAAAKCVNLGFAPASGSVGDTDSFQACQRMLRFEVEKGTSATLFGTQVDIMDDEGIMRRREGWPIEAAWTSDGPLCLSKLRWSMLPFGYAGLPDPRLDPTAQYCDDFIPQSIDVIAPHLGSLGIRMVSFSAIEGDALLTWAKLGSTGVGPGNFVTTTQGEYQPARVTTPPPGADPDVKPLYEGVVLTSPVGYTGSLVPLYSYTAGNIVTTNGGFPGAKMGLGFVAAAEPLFNGLPLTLYRTGTTYYGTTRHPGRLGIPATSSQHSQGYLLGWP